MEIFPLLLLAFAVSIDSFSVGLTYGLRRVQIPFHAIVIIAFCSGLALFSASIIGKYIGNILSPSIAEMIGGVILILLGVWALFQFFRSSHDKESDTKKVRKKESVLVKFELKSFGVVIQILRKPMSADLDRSGTITGFEALLLGIALSLDAMGAGFGASMLGFSPLMLAIVVGIMSAFFAFIGIKAGSSIANAKWVKQLTFLPGVLLIIIGIWKI